MSVTRILTLALLASVAGCAFGQQRPVAPVKPVVAKSAPRLGTSLIFPGGGTSGGGGGGSVTQGTSPWVVAVSDTANTTVKSGDAVNNAVRVNVVAGGAAGGTSSTLGAAIPGTGTAAGQSDGTNMQLPRVFDGDTGGGTQYVSGAILRKQASGGTVEAGTATDPLRIDPTGATTQPVSGTVTITPSGTQTVAGNLSNNAGAPGAVNIGALQAIANAAAPSWTEGRLVLASVDLGGSLRALITNTVTVSGTVAATQSGGWTVAATQSGAWSLSANQSVNAAQINGVTPLMGNGATGTGALRVSIANDSTGIVSQGGTWTVQPGNTANTTPWLTTDTPRTVASANNTGTCTSVTTSSTTVLASNGSRRGYGFKSSEANTVNVFCKLGATATTGAVPFGPGASWSQDVGAVYTGVIDCIVASGTASVCVYEFN